jgi:hypothetical protein
MYDRHAAHLSHAMLPIYPHHATHLSTPSMPRHATHLYRHLDDVTPYQPTKCHDMPSILRIHRLILAKPLLPDLDLRHLVLVLSDGQELDWMSFQVWPSGDDDLFVSVRTARY